MCIHYIGEKNFARYRSYWKENSQAWSMANLAKSLLFEYYGIGRTEQTDKGFSDNSEKDNGLRILDDIDVLDQDEDEEADEDSDELERENDADVAIDEKSEVYCQPPKEEILADAEFSQKYYETICETNAALNNYLFETTSNSNGVEDTSLREELIDSSSMLVKEPIADISLPISDCKLKKRPCKTTKTMPLPPAPKKIPTCNGIFLDLAAAGITVFPIEMLDKLSSLKMLYLDNNNLTSLPDELFSILRCLYWLDVRNNEIETLPSSIAGHPNLETILLQGNKIQELPLELSQLPNLKRLQVARNPLVFPPLDVVAQGCPAIVDCLQAQWNKIHPVGIKMENVESTEHDKNYEPKYDATTALCYQPTSLLPKKHKASDGSFAVSESSVTASKRKDCTNEKCARRKSWDYKPSNRCSNRGENPTISMQLAWINHVKELLTKEALAHQRVKDKEAVGNWRQDKRSFDKSMEKARKRSADDIPFAVDTNDVAANSKELLKMHGLKRSKKRKSRLIPPIDINEKITELSESLSHLQIERCSTTLSPRTEQKLLQMEIEKISQLQVQLEQLKLYNVSATAPLLKTHEIRREQAARPPSIII